MDGTDTSLISSKDEKFNIKDGGQTLLEKKLLRVVRSQIAENLKLREPLMATKRLARYCQHLKEETERLKLRAKNFEVGMARAERRSAMLQSDLYKAQKTGFSSEKVTTQVPFYLPSSIQQLIDSLTAENIALMKAVNKATEHPRGADILKKNCQMQEKVRTLEEEIALKTSLINQYETSLQSVETPSASEEATRNIAEHKKECNELKMKLRTYQSYVKHLREKNTAIMHSIMQEFDKRGMKGGPSESMDDGIDLFDGRSTPSHSGSQAASRSGSQMPSRRGSQGSLKDADMQTNQVYQNAESQTASEFSLEPFSGHSNDLDVAMNTSLLDGYSREIEELKEVNNKYLATIREHRDNKAYLAKLEARCDALSSDNCQMRDSMEKMSSILEKTNSDKMRLEKEVKEAEQILIMMQEQVDKVNMEHGDVNSLKEELKKCKEELQDLPMMQTVMRNYEEEIKEYHQERKQFLQKELELDYLRKKCEKLEMQQQNKANPILHATYKAKSPPPQQMQPIHREMPLEPWQIPNWSSPMNRMEGVVHDGGASRSITPTEGDSSQDRYFRRQDFDRSKSSPGGDNVFTRPSLNYRAFSSEQLEEQREYKEWENGTVKCENCGEKFPKILFQDHFRDCGR